MMYTPFARPIAAAVLVLLGAAAMPAQAFDQVVIFGDSLSDSGNNALVIGTDPTQVITGNSYVPTFPYASGTYSNGNVWATSFAAGLGLSALPSLAGGTDYAYGGALTHGAGYPPNLQKQLNQFLGSGPASIADTVFVIEGGGNNARDALASISQGAPQNPTINRTARRYASDIGNMVDALQAAGAQHIVVWDTPDIGLTPAVESAGSAASGLGTALATQMNLALASRLSGEAGVLTFDVFGLLDSVVASPSSYGLVNATDACGAILGCNPSSYLFWDGIHPTSAGHAILAQGMLQTLGITTPVPEPAKAWMLLAGVLTLAWRRRSRT